MWLISWSNADTTVRLLLGLHLIAISLYVQAQLFSFLTAALVVIEKKCNNELFLCRKFRKYYVRVRHWNTLLLFKIIPKWHQKLFKLQHYVSENNRNLQVSTYCSSHFDLKITVSWIVKRGSKGLVPSCKSDIFVIHITGKKQIILVSIFHLLICILPNHYNIIYNIYRYLDNLRQKKSSTGRLPVYPYGWLIFKLLSLIPYFSVGVASVTMDNVKITPPSSLITILSNKRKLAKKINEPEYSFRLSQFIASTT